MKIKFGALVVDGRNKIGGQVASKNKAGAYLKNKVTPTNPNTSAQANARANLTAVSRAWSALTEAQREAWNAYAAQYPYVDIFGDSKYLTGFNYFLKINLNLATSGVPMPGGIAVSPPATQDVSDVIFSIQTLETGPTVELVSATATMPGTTKVIVLASPALSAGATPSKSDLRQIKVATTLTAGVIDCSTEYEARFGDFEAGKKVGLATFCINTTTGLVSQMRMLSGTTA